jgi:hypothetical protein
MLAESWVIMAGVNTSFDVALMHAILYVKLHYESGSAFESTIHAVAGGNLGQVSDYFGEILEDLHGGVDKQIALDRVMRKSSNEAFKNLIMALASPPAQAVPRLEQIANQLQANKVSAIETYQNRVDTVIRMASITFMGSFLALLAGLAETVEQNDILPTLELAPGAISTFYMVLGGLLLVCLLAMWPRRA